MVDKEYRHCQGCAFAFPCFGTMLMCTYFLTTGIRRPCPAGDCCTVKQKGKKKTTWQYEAEHTWKIKQKKEKKVYHRVCPCCGVDFETTDPR